MVKRRKSGKTRRWHKRQAANPYADFGVSQIGDRLKAIGIKTYRSYLSSKHWKELRSHIFELRGRLCECCLSRDAELHLHHKTYIRLGCELDTDLIILCDSCHDRVHKSDHSGIDGGLEAALNRIMAREKSRRERSF